MSDVKTELDSLPSVVTELECHGLIVIILTDDDQCAVVSRQLSPAETQKILKQASKDIDITNIIAVKDHTEH